MHALTIGIAGGSGSGKTTVAKKIIEGIGADRISFLEMDSYYKDLTDVRFDDRTKHNFDHPQSIDIDLFLEHVSNLRNGNDIEKPLYDFVTHTRKKETLTIVAQPVIFLEGILLYENKDVRDLIDIKTFVESPSDIRFIRRLMRDIKERGRSPESVVSQYYDTVRPMYKTFVAPTKEYADVIIPWQDYNDVAVDMFVGRVEHTLKERTDTK